MNAKQRWKKLYRAIRVSRRENLKAIEDMMLFGTGCVFVPNDGSDPRRIDIKDMLLSELAS